MKQTIYRVLACILLWSSTCGAEQAGREPRGWWTTFSKTPTGRDIFGIPVTAIDTAWSKASVLESADFSDAQRASLATSPPWLLAVGGDFNLDGNQDKAVIGTYSDQHGRSGRFLLVMSRNGNGDWKKAYVESVEGAPGFSSLRWDASEFRLYWTLCPPCQPFASVRWTGREFALVYED